MENMNENTFYQNENNLNNDNQNFGEKDDFKMEKPKKNNPIPALLLVATVVVLSFFTYKRLMYKDVIDVASMPVVETTRLERGKIEKITSVMGTIMPSDTFYVVTKAGGEITKIYVENGKEVKMGDPICEIDNSKQVEAAFIQYDAAKKAYERMEKLFNAGDISAQSFESVKAQYEGAKLSYDTQVEFSTPTATGDGVIENTNMTLNVTINQGTVLCYITSNDAKNVEFAVTERVLDGIIVGDKVTIEKQGKTYEGIITEKSNLISQSTGLFNVKAVITSENSLASGGMAKVNFVYERADATDLIDRDIVYYENNRPFVYTVNPTTNKIEKKFIILGISNDKKVEVKSGISKSTKIVSTWNTDLVEGVEVDILNEKAAKELEDIYDNAKKSEATNNVVNVGEPNLSEENVVEQIATASEMSDEEEQIATASEMSDEEEQIATASEMSDEEEQIATASEIKNVEEQIATASEMNDVVEPIWLPAEATSSEVEYDFN